MNSYIKLMTIDTNKSFWEFFNNFDKLNYVDNQFFIMKDNISPMWEDLPDGANVVMSVKKLIMTPIIEIWTNLCAKIMSNQINIDAYDIKGIIFNMKYDLVNIKVVIDNAMNIETNEFSNNASFIKDFLEKEYPDNKYAILINKRDINYTSYNPRYRPNPIPFKTKKKYYKKH